MAFQASSSSKVDRSKVRVAYLVSHPIQYQAPLLRRISQEADIELTVFFASDFSVKGYQDVGFGVDVTWDVALLEGYRYEFLPSVRDLRRTGIASQISHGLFRRLRGSLTRTGLDRPAFDALWVHGYSTVNAWQAMLYAKALGIPVLLRAESWLGSRARGRWKVAAKAVFFHLLQHLVEATLPIGTHNQRYWSSCLGEQMLQFPVPYAVDNAYFERRAFEASQHRIEFRKELGLEETRPVVLFASKLQRRKRCKDLIAAYALLCSGTRSGPIPYLVIVGDGEEKVELELQAKASGLEGVRFCGFRNQSELPRFFDLASVFVLPSEYEPWGLVVNEAMNAGCAIVVSDGVGCQLDLVADGVQGSVFATGDVGGLALSLQRALDSAGPMGKSARKRIAEWDFEADVRGLRQALAAVTRRIKA